MIHHHVCVAIPVSRDAIDAVIIFQQGQNGRRMIQIMTTYRPFMEYKQQIHPKYCVTVLGVVHDGNGIYITQ